MRSGKVLPLALLILGLSFLTADAFARSEAEARIQEICKEESASDDAEEAKILMDQCVQEMRADLNESSSEGEEPSESNARDE